MNGSDPSLARLPRPTQPVPAPRASIEGPSGLYYNRARYYDPQLRRFISEDPIGLAGGINVYAYVGNNPVNGRDPSGLDHRCEDSYLDGLTIVVVTYVGGCEGYDHGEEILPPREPASGPDHHAHAGLHPGGSGRASSRTKLDPATRLLIYNYRRSIENLAECTVDQWFDDPRDFALRAGSWIGAWPVKKSAMEVPQLLTASPTTTRLNQWGRRVVGPMKLPGQAGRLLRRIGGSNKLTTVIARANVLLAKGLAVYDAASIFACAARN